MSKFGGMVCPACGAELKLQIWYDGCDWNSAAGEGSRFDYSVNLECTCCPRTYPIGRVRREQDFCENADGTGVYRRLSKMQEGGEI